MVPGCNSHTRPSVQAVVSFTYTTGSFMCCNRIGIACENKQRLTTTITITQSQQTKQQQRQDNDEYTTHEAFIHCAYLCDELREVVLWAFQNGTKGQCSSFS